MAISDGGLEHRGAYSSAPGAGLPPLREVCEDPLWRFETARGRRGGAWAATPSEDALDQVMQRGRSARWPRWRRAWKSTQLDEPWGVGPLVAMVEPAVAAIVAVVILLVALRAGAALTPSAFLALSLGMAAVLHAVGRYRAMAAFRAWTRLAAELPFALTGADRLLRRPAGIPITLEIHFEYVIPVEAQVVRATVDAAAIPGAPLVLFRAEGGIATVTAFGPAWLAAWAVKRLLANSMVALHDAYPIVRVDLRAGR